MCLLFCQKQSAASWKAAGGWGKGWMVFFFLLHYGLAFLCFGLSLLIALKYEYRSPLENLSFLSKNVWNQQTLDIIVVIITVNATLKSFPQTLWYFFISLCCSKECSVHRCWGLPRFTGRVTHQDAGHGTWSTTVVWTRQSHLVGCNLSQVAPRGSLAFITVPLAFFF